jgi:hypothetical protein
MLLSHSSRVVAMWNWPDLNGPHLITDHYWSIPSGQDVVSHCQIPLFYVPHNSQ